MLPRQETVCEPRCLFIIKESGASLWGHRTQQWKGPRDPAANPFGLPTMHNENQITIFFEASKPNMAIGVCYDVKMHR